MRDLGIVTPEAVRLEFEAAGLGSRVLSVLLDIGIQVTILLAATFFGAALGAAFGSRLPDWVPVVAISLLSFAVIWAYPVGCETLTRGRTPGKAALGLRVVTLEGTPVQFRHAAIRATLALVDYAVSAGAIAVIAMLVTQRHQRLGDLVAGTVVLRERTLGGSTAAVRFTVPAGAEGYAQTLDTAALPAEHYQQIRSYLLRAPALRPDARARLSQDLASRTAAALAHQPPGWVTPEVFLVIVAARFQQRPGAGPVEAPATGRPAGAVGGGSFGGAPFGGGSPWSPPPNGPPSQPNGSSPVGASPSGPSPWSRRPDAPVPAPPGPGAPSAPTAASSQSPEPAVPDRGFAPPG